ncbi:hypothetical protein HU200_062272 [Digitaria exilis]|uniref:Zinc-ribbon domain-containing protein n=1 Tax=Digitaria exilis TaxID=1010633 RepID=A0A835E028_9POAL|nr:hypothetical protein HU200_062272 [Digitaria exilis]
MAMEAQNLRFVRCPKCHQLLVEYPSIPVYKCGGCSTVLRAKLRVVPVAQASSGSEDLNSLPCSLKGSPKSSKSISSDEQKALSSIDQPREAMTDGSISSTINSCEGTTQERTMSTTESETHAEHPNEETCCVIDGNFQNSGVMVKETHDKNNKADSISVLTEKVENVDTSQNAHAGNFGTNDVSTLYEKTEVFHREERMHTFEGMHAQSHKALIEELERSLSFSSDDDYFSDEAENSGLSHTLCNQMGSRRFMLGIKMHDASRNDPHGRLIEELEMSFSDAEEPAEQHALVADGVHRNVHDMDPQTLGPESAHPDQESFLSCHNGHLKSEQISHQENRLLGNDNHGKEYVEDDNNTASYVHEGEHIVISSEEIPERFHDIEQSKDMQSPDMENAYPYEGSTSSVDDGTIKIKQSFQPDDLMANVTQEMEDICTEDDRITNCVHGNDNPVLADEDIAEGVSGNKDISACGIQEMEDGNLANCVHVNDNLVLADENIAERVHGKEEQTADGTQEMEEGYMEDDNVSNHVHVNDSVVLADEDIADRVDGNEETSGGTGETEESCMENENENVAVADEDVRGHEQGKDWQSLEAESAHLYEEAVSSFSGRHVKPEQCFQQDEPIADGTKEKEEAYMEDGNMTSCVQKNNAAVGRFSSLPNKRTQCKLASFNKNKEQISYRYRGNQLYQRRSLDSEDFNSIQNFMESQMDATSSSLSSGSRAHGDSVHRTSNKFKSNIRHERLKKMDELRDQLSRLSSQKGSERSYQNRGLENQQQSNSYDIEQHVRSVNGDSLPSSCALESYYGHGRPPRYQPPHPFSPSHTNTHCHFGHGQTHLPHNYDPWEFTSYYQSSYSESTVLDHETLGSSYKEQKRVVRKHILRPLSGASPFTICNSCFNLVRMPSDIYISKAKVGKMQCGKCSKVLALSFPALCIARAKINMDMNQEPYDIDDSTITKNEHIASYYAECLTGGPVSISEDYGASYTRSLPAQAGSSLAATQSSKKVSDSALHRLMGYDSASQLLRHSRVFEDGYESFESMVPISSRVSKRKNM